MVSRTPLLAGMLEGAGDSQISQVPGGHAPCRQETKVVQPGYTVTSALGPRPSAVGAWPSCRNPPDQQQGASLPLA
jgi:hypothetical protein